MRFSIIVPIYKVEEFLEVCVDSLLAQEYPDFEVILVDDGSPDGCPQICDAYKEKDGRVKVVHKENGGLSDARNAGIREATGDYLMFVDSDDFLSGPEVLSTIANVIAQTGATIIQYGRQNYLNQDRHFVPPRKRDLARLNGQSGQEALRELVKLDELMISACSIAISAAFLREHQGYFTKNIKSEDLEWAIRLYVHNPQWAFCDEHFYIYRMQRTGSITLSIDYRHLCDYCWIIDKNIKLIEQQAGENTEALMSYMMYHVLIGCALCYRVELSKQQKKEILGKLKQFCKGRMNRYAMGKKTQMGSLCYRIGGFRFMARVVGFYLNSRRRKKKGRK